MFPYAVTKYVNELYADVYARTYGTESIWLRYFNEFGCRQDPEGAYAAVIPKWIACMIKGKRCISMVMVKPAETFVILKTWCEMAGVCETA